MLVAAFVGCFSVYLFVFDDKVPESTMVITAVGGVVSGILVGLVHRYKKGQPQKTV